MSEILFRAKRLDNNEWIEGYYVPVCLGRFPCVPCIVPEPVDLWEPIKVDPSTIGMCVPSITDKNGRKLFDGDIVHETVTSYYQPIGKICYNVENCQWRIEYVNDVVTFSSVGSGRIYELLGNIYDNPELLLEENNET